MKETRGQSQEDYNVETIFQTDIEKTTQTHNELPTDKTNITKENSDETPAIPFSAFTKTQKRWITFLVAFAGMFSPMSSFIYYPAITSIADNLGISIQAVNLTVTSYMVVSGVFPAILGNVADLLGRRPVYLIAFMIYIVANIGLALQRSFPALLTLRMLQSAGSSGTISLSYGVIADIASPHERGSYVGVVLVGPNIAPPLGPILGGIIADRLGWPYIFWFLCCLSGICLLTIVFVLPETARSVVGNGSIPPKGIYRPWLPISRHSKRETTEYQLGNRSRRPFPNPLRSLGILLEKDSAIIITCNGIFYATYCCLQTSLSSLFIDIYHYGELQAGLVYIPFGVGCLVASLVSGKLLDLDYAKVAKSQNIEPTRTRQDLPVDFAIEKARLRSIFYPVAVSMIGIIGYGWALQNRVNVSVPLIIQATTGASATAVFTCLGTLLTDIHPKTSSTAAAAANIVRCALAAAATAVLQLLIDAVGVGWCFTLIGAVSGLCIPLLYIERRIGIRWRISRERVVE